MDNNTRYLNIIKKLNLQEENSISEALKKKGLYSASETFPLSAIHFELTYRCNAFCRHCYNNSGVGEDVVSPDNWIEFSNYLVNKGGVFECLLSGGEPFILGDKLFEIMDIFHEDGSIFMLMSNGSLITENIAERLKKYRYHWLQLSIDGPDEEYHDWFRNCKGLWKKAINAAKVLSKREIPLKIACCITPYNLEKTKLMFMLAKDLGASSIIVGEVSLSGRTNANRDFLLSDEQREKLWDLVGEAKASYGGSMLIKTSNKVKRGLEKHSENPRSCVVIRPNGDIRIDGMAPFVIGNILRDDFESVWNDKIDYCWQDERVRQFISGFNDDDRNFEYVNFYDKDIYLK